MKLFWSLLAGAALWAATFHATAATATTDLFPDPAVARGKGFEIKRSELDEVVTGFRATAAARGQNVPAEQMPALESELLRRLLEVRLFNLKATGEQKKAGAALATNRFEEAVQKGAPTREMYYGKLRSLGSSPDKLLARLTDEAVAELVLNTEVRLGVTIADADIQKFYDENPGYSEEPEKVALAHIYVDARTARSPAEVKEKRDKADALLKRARSGEDFAALAKQFSDKLFSDDVESKDKSGELAPFPRGTFQRLPEFEAMAFALGLGQISDVIMTQVGFHILKVKEKIPARRLPLADVKDKLKEVLENREVIKRKEAYVAQLKKELNVEILYGDDRTDIPAPAPGTGGAK